MKVDAVLVTHDSARWIEQTLASVLSQLVDRVVVVDDGSSDDTVEICRRMLGSRGSVVMSTSADVDITTRIASNFRQGVVACADADVVVLGDHDDIWHPDRVKHQAAAFEADHKALMVASDGRLIDETGTALGGTLRTAFPVPAEWATATPGERMRMALRWSIATGGASAIRPGAFASIAIPPGWLHDRWWSLVATAREGMIIDDATVIDYRVTDAQQVGLVRGHQGKSSLQRLVAGAAQAPRIRRRIADIRQYLAPLATEATRPQVQGVSLVRNLA